MTAQATPSLAHEGATSGGPMPVGPSVAPVLAGAGAPLPERSSKAGYQHTRCRTMTDERQAQARRLAAAGHTLSEVAAKLELAKQTLQRWAKSRSVTFRQQQFRLPVQVPYKVSREALVKAQEAGWHVAVLARSMGVSNETVQRAARHYGIELTKGRAPKVMSAIMKASPKAQAHVAELRRAANVLAVQKAAAAPVEQPRGLPFGSLVDVAPNALLRGLAEHLGHLALPSWPAARNLALVEGMAAGVGAGPVAARLRVDEDEAVARYKALCKPIRHHSYLKVAGGGHRNVYANSIAGQAALVAVLRNRACLAQGGGAPTSSITLQTGA